MKIELPLDVKNIIEILEENGHAAYAVGGCVRDSILGQKPKDWDITTSAKPEEVKSLFKKTIDTGIQHGTVTIMIGHNGYEVTTFRIDGEYLDGRHPEEVCFTDDLREDLRRRDFTINAMAYNDREGLVDIYEGIVDLERHLIRSVGDPRERFSEDALRMMRAVRFAARFDFEIEENTVNAIKELAPTLAKVSAERIREEFVKTIYSKCPERLVDYYELGLSQVFMKEWGECLNTEQNTPHHCYNVGRHIIEVVRGIPEGNNRLKLAAFFHDIGKPLSKTTDETGRDHFKMHNVLGVEVAGDIMRRLKFDNNTIKYVKTMVQYHDARPGNNERAARRLLRKIGRENADDFITLQVADVLAQSEYMRDEKLSVIRDTEKCFKIVIEREDALSVKDLKIDGRDLISMGVKPGPMLGQILNYLLDEVMKIPSLNDRTVLIEMVQEYLDEMREENE